MVTTGRQVPGRATVAQRWLARLALVAAAAAVLVPLAAIGFRQSVALVLVGVAGMGLAAAGVWWALTNKGLVRGVAVAVAVAAPLGDIGRNLFFQRDREHPSRAFARQFIEVHDELGAALVTYYTQHRGVPSSPTVARRRTPACWSSRKVRRALIQQADPQLQVIPLGPVPSEQGPTALMGLDLRLTAATAL